MPVFNGGQHLACSIESVLAQSFNDFELIISDDGSTDGSLEVCRQFAARDARVKVVEQVTNLGLFANYNFCLSQARGRYLKPMAQDDLLAPSALERCAHVLDSHESVVIVSMRRTFINDAGEDISKTLTSTSVGDYFPVETSLSGKVIATSLLLPPNNFIGEPVTVMLRQQATPVRFTEEYAHVGDWATWIELLKKGHFYFIDDALCSYRMHDNSQTSRNWKDLRVGTDFVKFRHRNRELFEALRLSEHDFIAQAVSSVAVGVRGLSELNGYKWFLAGTADGAMSEEDGRAFKELCVHALYLLAGAGGAREHAERESKTDVEHLETSVNELLASASWRTTRPLRTLTALLGGKDDTEGEYRMAIDTVKAPGDKAKAYMRYLEEVLLRVKASRSWRLTKPLRKLQRLSNAVLESVEPNVTL